MTQILVGSGASKPSAEEILEDILLMVSPLPDLLSPLPASLVRTMPGTPEAFKSADYANSGISLGYFEKSGRW